MAKDAAELVMSNKVHLAQYKNFQELEPEAWGAKVMSLVVTDGGNRTSAHRELAKQYMQEIETWSSVEKITDIVMLDFD
eukprot:69021-Pyramimonas_sp.AAC.1